MLGIELARGLSYVQCLPGQRKPVVRGPVAGQVLDWSMDTLHDRGG